MHTFLPKRQTYLLTIWQEDVPFSLPVWRIRVVDTRASCVYGFSTPGELLRFLEEQIASMAETRRKEQSDE